MERPAERGRRTGLLGLRHGAPVPQQAATIVLRDDSRSHRFVQGPLFLVKYMRPGN